VSGVLNREQVRVFAERGFVVVRQIVPPGPRSPVTTSTIPWRRRCRREFLQDVWLDYDAVRLAPA
jgi:hypothetical protein